MDRSTVGMDCYRRVIPSFLDFGDPSGTMPTLDETLSLADFAVPILPLTLEAIVINVVAAL